MSSGTVVLGQTVGGGGGGGTVTSVTASTPLASSGGATPNITLASPVPLSLGGGGLSEVETINSTAGVILTLAIPTAVIRFTASTFVTLAGIQNNGTNQTVTIIASLGAGAQLNLNNQNASVAAANRLALPGNNSIIINNGQTVTFYYDLQLTRWIVLSTNQTATSNTLGYLSSGTQSIGGVKTFTAAPVFSALTGNSVVCTDGSLGLRTDENNFCYFPSTDRVGIQTNIPLASLHVKTTLGDVVPAVATGSATYNGVSNQAPTVTPSINTLASLVTSISANQNNSESGFTANGSNFIFTFYTFLASESAWTVTGASLSFTDDNSGNPFGIDLSWTAPTLGDSITILCSINGGPPSARVLPASTTSTTDENDFVDSTNILPSLTNVYPAVGTTRSYTAYSEGVDGNGLTYFSSSDPYSISDSNDGSYYRVTHSGISGLTKVIGAADGSSANSSFSATISFDEGPDAWTGDTVSTPNSFGYPTDGANRSYQIYAGKNIAGANPIYSSTPLPVSAADTTANPFYVIDLTWSAVTGADFYKILMDNGTGNFNNSYTVTGLTFEDDLVVVQSNDVTVTPNSSLTPSFISEGLFDTTALGSAGLPPQAIVSTTQTMASNGYSKLDFRDSAGSMGSVQADQNGIHIQNSTGNLTLTPAGGLSVNGTAGFTGTGSFTHFVILNGIITNAT